MKEKMDKNLTAIDQTIEDMCDWIQKGLENNYDSDEILDMTKALAELVRARAKDRIFKI